MRTVLFALVSILLAVSVNAQANVAQGQLTTSSLGERQQRALFSDPTFRGSFLLPISTGLPTPSVVDNGAARQLQATKDAFPFLATLPNQGSSNFFTMLKPCGLILPHIHPRGTEQYLIIAGRHQAGLAEENGGRQNITFIVSAGQSFVAPQGMVHFNANPDCTPNVFIQSFNSADAGTIGLTNALSGLKTTAPGVLAAANFSSVAPSPQNAFALDPACLQRCNLPSTGSPVGVAPPGLSNELAIFLGLASAAPTTAPTYGPAGPASG